jgi:DNA-directed RNA polymerase specialized sigma subunit
MLEGLETADRWVFEYHLRDRRPLEEVRRLLEARHGIRIDAGELKRRAARIEDSLSPSQRWRLVSRFWARRQPVRIDPVRDLVSDEDAVPLRSETRDPEAALASKAAGAALREALDRIEPRKRLALTLRYKDGLRVRDAARILRATEKQVEHWVREGTALIREHLARGRVLRDDLGPDQLNEMWGP